MAAQPEDRWKLDELEHQALDTLDSIDADELSTMALAGAADLHVEDAITTARSLFLRLVAAATDDLLRAAEVLATTEDRGTIEPEAIDGARRALNEHREWAPAFAHAVEMVGITLGLDRRSLAWALLVEIGERASGEAPEPVLACARVIGERLDAARTAIPSRELRVFRSASVASAGPELRARLLAADHPEQLALARALIEADAEADPATLVDRFDVARAALAAQALEGDQSPEAITDGPKRKFTIVHAILALIILGPTIWHYVFR
jgi:hypothetical protein